MELKQRIVQGLGWNLTGSLCTQLINFGTKIVTARLLLPADFGLFAMAFIFLNFLNSFVGMGIMSALIARKEDSITVWQTGFTLSILLGALFSLLGFLFSGIIGSFFQQPALQPMIQVLSLVFLFDSISTILIGSLVKDLAFQRKIIAELASIFCYSVFIIGFALAGYGVWSIVLAYVIQHALLTLFLWIACLRKPSFGFDTAIAWELLHFGKYVIGSSFFAWAITSIDNIVVGRQLKEEQLGYYSLGFTVATLPVLSATHIITGVFHPIYAKLQDDVTRLKVSYLKPLEWSLLLMFPFSVGLFLLAKPLVLVLFGEKWVSMVPMLYIFSIYCIPRTVCTIIAQLLEGIGKPKAAMRVVFVEFIILGGLLLFVMPYKLIGVALVVVIARIVSMILYLIEIRKIISVSFIDYWKVLAKKVFAALIMGAFVFYAQTLFLKKDFFMLIFSILLGMSIYFLTLFIIEKRLYAEVAQLLK